MRVAWVALLGAACTGSGTLDPADPPGTDTPVDTDPSTDDDTAPPPGETGDTGMSVATPTTLTAVCTLQPDNALRFDCAVDVDPPQAVEIAFSKADGTGPERVHTSADALAQHDVGLYFMAPRTDYAFTARAPDSPDGAQVTGTVTTELPASGARVELAVEGVSSAAMVGFTSPCAEPLVLVATTEGEVLWYQEFPAFGGVEGAHFTEDGTVVALLNDGIVEVDLRGRELLDLQQGTDFVKSLHHDVFRRDGLTYALFNEVVPYQGNEYTLDGIYVFDDTGAQVGEWHLFDHFQPVSWDGPFTSADYSHANSVWVDATGDLFVSLRHLSGVLKLRGDPAAPDFGEILWRASGDPADPDLGSDFTLTTSVGGPATFEQQHNVHLLPDGRMAMFDNRIGFGDPSRLLQLQLDELAMTLDITGVYTLPLHCDFQGGAWHTDAGNPMATCAPFQQVFEFSDGGAGPHVWSMEADCSNGGFGIYIPRFTPLEW